MLVDIFAVDLEALAELDIGLGNDLLELSLPLEQRQPA